MTEIEEDIFLWTHQLKYWEAFGILVKKLLKRSFFNINYYEDLDLQARFDDEKMNITMTDEYIRLFKGLEKDSGLVPM